MFICSCMYVKVFLFVDAEDTEDAARMPRILAKNEKIVA